MSVEMYRIRRTFDGWYLAAIPCGGRNDVNLRWWGPVAGMPRMQQWPREQAAHIAAAMIAITGDHGIAIEPVEEQSKVDLAVLRKELPYDKNESVRTQKPRCRFCLQPGNRAGSSGGDLWRCTMSGCVGSREWVKREIFE